jgi:triacylglycerol lipase
MLRALLLIGLCSLSACRTAQPAGAQAKDFDTGANPSLKIDFDQSIQTFCPNARTFNMSNAYWLSLASAYSYATQATIATVVDSLKKQSPSLTAQFIASPDSTNPLASSTQALWLESDTVAIVAFRGTPLDRIDVQDIISDANALPIAFDASGDFGKVHKGFKSALDSVWGQVEPRLIAAAQAQKPIFITGHSLGAAIATLAAAKLVMLDRYASVRPFLHGLYTLGSPRVGMDEFLAKFHAAYAAGTHFPIVRMRNEQDIVTRVPPATGFGYRQHVAPVFFWAADGRLFSADDGLGFSRYAMPADVAAGMKETFVPTDVRDLKAHLPTNYFGKVAAEYSQFRLWTAANDADVCDDASGFYQTTATAQPVVAVPAVLANVGAVADAILPDHNAVGGRLPGTGEAVVTVLKGQDNRGVASAWNRADGRSFARKTACNFSTVNLLRSKEENARRHFCNGARTGFAGAGQDSCKASCQQQTTNGDDCLQGCFDWMTSFCQGGQGC